MSFTSSLQMEPRIAIGAGAIAFLFLLLVSAAQSQMVRSDEETARILSIEQLSIKEGVVQGQVRNKSDHAVRDVQLFIRYTWLWDDERNPGKIDPGTSTYYTLKETIQPKATVSFIFAPSPPLPKIAGGRFDASVKIAGLPRSSHRRNNSRNA